MIDSHTVRMRAKMLCAQQAAKEDVHIRLVAETWENSVREIMQAQIRYYDFPADAEFTDFLAGWRSAGKPVKHGTKFAYVQLRCRCEDCREWNRMTMRAHRRSKKSADSELSRLMELPVDHDEELLRQELRDEGEGQSLFMRKYLARVKEEQAK